jgi:acetylglutamate synthase
MDTNGWIRGKNLEDTKKDLIETINRCTDPETKIMGVLITAEIVDNNVQYGVRSMGLDEEHTVKLLMDISLKLIRDQARMEVEQEIDGTVH